MIKKVKNEKGVITLAVLISMLFVLTFVMSLYIIIANRAQVQKELTEQTRKTYNNAQDLDDIYNGYFGDTVVPIYTVEQLLKIGSNERIAISEEKGKIYDFSNTAIYQLMNNLEFDVDNWQSILGANTNWTPIGKTNYNFEWNGHKVKVIQSDNRKFIYKEVLYKVGDYVLYTPDTANAYSLLSTHSGNATDQLIQQEEMNWRILNINDDGTVDLISDIPTKALIGFNGPVGYNNIVYVLNDICDSQYKNETLGTSARSINLEDIENKMNNEGISARNSYNNGIKSFGQSKSYTTSNASCYPNLYANENGAGINTNIVREDGLGISENGQTELTTDTYTQANSGLSVTQTYYKMSNLTSYFNEKDYETLNLSKSYFMASRCAYCGADRAFFGYFRMHNSEIAGSVLYYSDNTNNLNRNYLRPIVSLNTDIEISDEGGTLENPRTLDKWE